MKDEYDFSNGEHKRGLVPKLQRLIEQTSQLLRANQKFVMDMFNTMIQQQASGLRRYPP